MDTIQIFIASEAGHEKAELTLAYTIKQTTTGPYQIHWMSDALDDPIWRGWNVGRDHRNQNSGQGWKTNFSAFRWAIPELCNFQGRAIYLDVDQILLHDIRQMWQLPMNDCSYLAIRPEKTDVMLMDCTKFQQPWWLPIAKMKPSGKSQRHYRKLVGEHTKVGTLDPIYNCLDGHGFSDKTRLVHYTCMLEQPWHPFPKIIAYRAHRCPTVANLWYKLYNEALNQIS